MASLLIVDDDNTFRKILREILQRHDHTVFEAVNGKETLEFLSENS
ncbi:MAG: response regulator, partial [Spirochaetales bacterium]